MVLRPLRFCRWLLTWFPTDQRQPVFEHLVKKINEETHGHVGTGLVGGQWLNRVLTAGGRADLAYGFATTREYPSWGYMVAKDATTVWELWNGDTADPAMNSGNHVMLVGDLVIWLYENLAGIQTDPRAAGLQACVDEAGASGRPEICRGVS